MKRVAVVIGGSSGIGLETIKQLKAENYIIYNASRDACQEAGVINYTLDVVNNNCINEVLTKIYEKEGRIDVGIYSAGFSMAAYFEETKEEDYRYLFEVNFFGAVTFLQKLISYMKKQKSGRLIVVSSVASDAIIPYDPFYSASKSALNSIIKEVNIELNKHNLYATTILPGGTKTNFTFKRKNYHQADNTDNNFNRTLQSLAKKEQGGSEPCLVAKAIMKSIKNKMPKPLVVVGFKNKIKYEATKRLPTRLSNKLIKSKYSIKEG